MKKFLIMFFLVLVMSSYTQAQELTVNEIIQKANLASYYKGKDGLSDVSMTITDSQGRKRIREFRIMRLNLKDGGNQKFYVYFKKPADVSKMVYMVWKNLNNDDDRWLYLPALDLVKRVASSDKRSSFVGSHFVYEDISGRNIEDDVHTLLESDNQVYKIKNVPKDLKGLEFAYYFIWIDKINFLPMKAEYYDSDSKLLRSIEALEVKEIQGYPTVLKSIAKDYQRNGETVMDFSNIKYDVGLTENIFVERYLRRAPLKWIR